MRRCGIPLAVANALPEVKRAAVYVSRRSGGDGAAAELIEWLLRLDGTWQRARALS
jgi:3-deoxy-D-manno-octulosonate 8-phosphate phosphatase (KDO 8-P phosphatase)